MSKIIRVFEHETLKVNQVKDGVIFKQKHFDALAKYNEKNENKYYTLVHRGVKFRQYVGVIQTGQLTIEILPKIKSLAEDDELLWQSILFHMLKQCHFIKMDSFSEAQLKYRHNSLLDLYFEEYLKEVNNLIRRGLIKKYRNNQGNINSLRGSIVFPKHISKNTIHKERFYTEHSIYDKQHLANQILLEGLHVLDRVNHNHSLADGIKRTLFNYPEIERRHITKKSFERLKLDRKTIHYKRALEIAKLIILNYSPDITGGSNDLLAILFDMNSLWEEFVYRQLLKSKDENTQVLPQRRQQFWENKVIKPDIVIRRGDETFIIDTKWKVLDQSKPSDNDLKQMFAYNIYWECANSVLIYPRTTKSPKDTNGKYHKGMVSDHGCTLAFLNILDESNKLRRDGYNEVWDMIDGNFTHSEAPAKGP